MRYIYSRVSIFCNNWYREVFGKLIFITDNLPKSVKRAIWTKETVILNMKLSLRIDPEIRFPKSSIHTERWRRNLATPLRSVVPLLSIPPAAPLNLGWATVPYEGSHCWSHQVRDSFIRSVDIHGQWQKSMAASVCPFNTSESGVGSLPIGRRSTMKTKCFNIRGSPSVNLLLRFQGVLTVQWKEFWLKNCARWVPPLLTSDHKKKRLDCVRSFFKIVKRRNDC